MLPGPTFLVDGGPWRRCDALGCGGASGHEGEHVPEAVPPAPVPATPDRASATPDPCTCSGHGPDLECPDHGARLRAWQRQAAPREYAAAVVAALAELLDALDAEPGPVTQQGAHRARIAAAQRAGAAVLGRVGT